MMVTNKRTFWHRYVEAVQDSGVPEYQQRWYVIRVKEFLKATPEDTLKAPEPGKCENIPPGIRQKRRVTRLAVHSNRSRPGDPLCAGHTG